MEFLLGQIKNSFFFTFDYFKFKDKWTNYDCIFSSVINNDGTQHSQLELHSKNNIHEPNGKIIDLTELRSLTCLHGSKNEPRDIIILKIDSKKHRLGFDNVYDYNQWKSLLDGVFNSAWDTTIKNPENDNSAINMLYESTTGKKNYRIVYLLV